MLAASRLACTMPLVFPLLSTGGLMFGRFVVVFGVALVLLGEVVSCDSPNDAPAKCDALVTTICVRVGACANDGRTQAECEASAKTGLPCAQADAVSDGYNSCMSEVETSPCSVLFANGATNLPATCHASILFRP